MYHNISYVIQGGENMLTVDELLDIAVARVKKILKERDRQRKKYLKRCRNRDKLYKNKRR